MRGDGFNLPKPYQEMAKDMVKRFDDIARQNADELIKELDEEDAKAERRKRRKRKKRKRKKSLIEIIIATKTMKPIII